MNCQPSVTPATVMEPDPSIFAQSVVWNVGRVGGVGVEQGMATISVVILLHSSSLLFRWRWSNVADPSTVILSPFS
jgi:hypothetical protein